jgi:hypothetical protein
MLNLIQILRQALGHRGRAAPDPASRGDPDDPFAHPVIGGMSPTELADLPFPRARPSQGARPRCGAEREAA